MSPSACLYYSIRTIPCQDVFSTSYKKLTYRFLEKHGLKLVYRMHRQADFMQHFFMSLDTLVILHYNKYRDYGRIWATTHRLSERGTVMKKRRFDWLRKTSSADVMNPKNYEYRLKQLAGRTERSIYVVSEACRRRRCICTVSDRNVFSAWSWCGKR